MWFGATTLVAVIVAAIIFLALNTLIGVTSTRAFFAFVRPAPARFPSPDQPPAGK